MIINKIFFMFRKKLIIGEPWDYSHPKFGHNQIFGTVLFSTRFYIAFWADDVVEVNNEKSRLLILYNRNEYSYNIYLNGKFVMIGHLEQINSR